MPDHKPSLPGKYIDPLVDFAFKKIFGSEPNKDLLIAFLNEVFRGRKYIVDLSYNKNEHQGDLQTEGAAIFDLLCKGTNGEQFLIEVQRGRQGNFKERALFYTSRLISNLAPKGRRSDWAYNLTEIYFIALLEDFSLEVNQTKEYLHDICLCNRDTGKIFYDKLGFTYIELLKFVKLEFELETDLDKWLFMLKNMSQMDKIPVYLRKPIFEKLFNIAEYSNLTKEEKEMYDSSLKYKWDNKNVLDYAITTAKAQGREEGREEERVKTLEEKKFITLGLLKEGLSIEFISKITRLSIDDIEKLSSNI